MLLNICSTRKMHFLMGNFTGRAPEGDSLTAPQQLGFHGEKRFGCQPWPDHTDVALYAHRLPPAKNPTHPSHRAAYLSLIQGFRSRFSPKCSVTRAVARQRVPAWKTRVGFLDVDGGCYQHFRQLNKGVATKNKSGSQFHR